MNGPLSLTSIACGKSLNGKQSVISGLLCCQEIHFTYNAVVNTLCYMTENESK